MRNGTQDLPAVTPLGTRCTRCDAEYSACSCADVASLRNTLVGLGGLLCDEGRHREAAAVLAVATELGEHDISSLLLACYCFAAAGDLTAAREIAMRCAMRPDGAEFRAVHDELGTAEVLASEQGLVQALLAADKGDWPSAARALDRCTTIEVPAVAALRALVIEGISSSSIVPAPRWHDRSVLFTALLVVAVFGSVAVGRHYPLAAPPTPLPLSLAPTSTPSPNGASALASGGVSRAAGRLFYRFGREALQSHDTSLAIVLLSRAADAPADAYFVDDALFQLMLVFDSWGDLPNRTAVATRIASLSPASTFLNSLTRRFIRETP